MRCACGSVLAMAPQKFRVSKTRLRQSETVHALLTASCRISSNEKSFYSSICSLAKGLIPILIVACLHTQTRTQTRTHTQAHTQGHPHIHTQTHTETHTPC